VLREAARDVVTPEIFGRQKHPFFAPPATDGLLGAMVQDTLRGTAIDSVPFFDKRKVVGLLDALPSLPIETRAAMDAPLLLMLSTVVMHKAFALSA
jgi:asparagine synthase (glutamine-hydrolysing)